MVGGGGVGAGQAGIKAVGRSVAAGSGARSPVTGIEGIVVKQNYVTVCSCRRKGSGVTS